MIGKSGIKRMKNLKKKNINKKKEKTKTTGNNCNVVASSKLNKKFRDSPFE